MMIYPLFFAIHPPPRTHMCVFSSLKSQSMALSHRIQFPARGNYERGKGLSKRGRERGICVCIERAIERRRARAKKSRFMMRPISKQTFFTPFRFLTSRDTYTHLEGGFPARGRVHDDLNNSGSLGKMANGLRLLGLFLSPPCVVVTRFFRPLARWESGSIKLRRWHLADLLLFCWKKEQSQ